MFAMGSKRWSGAWGAVGMAAMLTLVGCAKQAPVAKPSAGAEAQTPPPAAAPAHSETTPSLGAVAGGEVAPEAPAAVPEESQELEAEGEVAASDPGCKEYLAALDHLSRCNRIPKDTKEALVAARHAMVAAVEAASAGDREVLATACAAGLTAIRETTKDAGC